MDASFAEGFMDIQKEFRTNLKPVVHVDDTTVKEFNEVIDPHDHALDPYHNFVKKYLDKPKPVLRSREYGFST